MDTAWQTWVEAYLKRTGWNYTELAFFCRPGARGRSCVTDKTVQFWLQGMAVDQGRERGWRHFLSANEEAFTTFVKLISDLGTDPAARVLHTPLGHVERRGGR